MDEDILLLEFNMTNVFTIHQTALIAERLNLSSIYEEYRGNTGFKVLLNARRGEQLHALRSNQTEDMLSIVIHTTLKLVK